MAAVVVRQCRYCKKQFSILRSSAIRRGDIAGRFCSRSCSCRARSITHGLHDSVVYSRWQGMKNRCLNPYGKEWKRYGGRGITVCERWMKFENFFADMGHPPTLQHTLDRIDPNGNYEPSNCRWASSREQADNKRNTLRLTHNRETLTVKEWARRLGIRYDTLWRRLQKESVGTALHGPLGRNARLEYLRLASVE